MNIRHVLPTVLCVSLAACASAPVADDLARLPVVRYGDPVPSRPFVVLYPAGTPLPMVASVSGSAFSKTAKAKLTVVLKHDIYTYNHWASLDRKHWEKGDELIKGSFRVGIPGYRPDNVPVPGEMTATFDLK